MAHVPDAIRATLASNTELQRALRHSQLPLRFQAMVLGLATFRQINPPEADLGDVDRGFVVGALSGTGSGWATAGRNHSGAMEGHPGQTGALPGSTDGGMLAGGAFPRLV